MCAGAADLDARRRQTTRRRRPASLPAGVHLRLLAAGYLDHAARLLVPARQPDHGQHRSRDLVPSIGARGRLAAVQPGQSIELGRARIRTRQHLHPPGNPGGQYRAGRTHTARPPAILIFLLACAWHARAAEQPAGPPDERDTLAHLWTGIYDITEELIAGEQPVSPLVPLVEQQRVQVNVRQIPLPWLGSHVLYIEEYPYDEPFERRRRVLLSIEPPAADGSLRVRQYTRRPGKGNFGALTADDGESVEGCGIFLKREGEQFRGGTLDHKCLAHGAGEARWLDYRVVIGDGLFWYRKRTLTVARDELTEEIAGFPHVDLKEARLFSCGISWAPDKAKAPRRPLENVDLHDRGGRARFR